MQYRGVDSTGRTAPAGRQRRADAVVDDALRWVDAVDGSPYFLWVHLYDAHVPYDPPEPYASIYGHNPYMGEIAFADSQIGRLLDALDVRQLMERTIVIVAGDHGESLGDHGEQDHGVFVYESVLRVPLIIRAPAVSPRRVGAVVRLIDVMPTVLDLLGIPAPRADGVSLVELLTGQRSTLDLEAYSESDIPTAVGVEFVARAARRQVQADRCTTPGALRPRSRSLRGAQSVRRAAGHGRCHDPPPAGSCPLPFRDRP